MYKVAIIDTAGLAYDGNTLKERGLGGSESAMILIGEELAKIGYDVTIFNRCVAPNTSPGKYNGVTYRYFQKDPIDEVFDIVLSSRSIAPFVPDDVYRILYEIPNVRYLYDNLNCSQEFLKSISKYARWKVLWMHDTFCYGDEHVERMLLEGYINEIFTLSDFHTSYVTNCDHGRKRMFESMKRFIWQTRDGVVNRKGWVDITKKDPNLFVYNASITKGMMPLVTQIWPKFYPLHAMAKLKVIGGYYVFGGGRPPDQQELDWRKLYDEYNGKMNIEFTGVIPQQQIADILSEASYFAYPCAFPETYGISMMEAVNYNTPLITCRFGSMEENAREGFSYLLDYPAVPNSLFPFVNNEDQVNKFVDLMDKAYQDRYLWQQKANYCNIIKDIIGWDTIALQWHQHLTSVMGDYLPVETYRKVTDLNNRIADVFGRRFSTPEQITVRKQKEQRIVVISPYFNGLQYLKRLIDSVNQQNYDNWHMYLINDASTEHHEDLNQVLDFRKITCINNTENKGAVRNQLETIGNFCYEDDIIILLDGDDALVNSPHIFDFYNNIYHEGYEVTYGSSWSEVDNIPLVAQEYPPEIKANKRYRSYQFNWGMPYTHLRTFRAKHLMMVNHSEFKDEKGNYFKAGGDNAVFYKVLENVDPAKIKVVQDIVMLYNDKNPLNDYKVNGSEQNKNRDRIVGKKKLWNKFSVIIPTMWKPDMHVLFQNMLQDYVDHPLVDEILIIDNDTSAIPSWNIFGHDKIKIIHQTKNIGVNPAWNLAVPMTRNELLIFGTDDIRYDLKLLEKIQPLLTREAGVFGILQGEERFNQPLFTDGSINFKEYKSGDNLFGFGQTMFLHRDNYIPIPEQFKIYFGDDIMIHNQLRHHRKVYCIYNIAFQSLMATTVKDLNKLPEYKDQLENERKEWFKWWSNHPIPSTTVQIKKPEDLFEMKMTEQRVMKIEGAKKKILIAIPTSRYIEPDTFKSIYDLEIPDGYVTYFQYFYGYQVDQVRNLIADWVVKGYDYLFAVDHDITFDTDTLKRLLAHNKDLVSAVYMQRKEHEKSLEIYDTNGSRFTTPLSGLLEPISACGFGCVLVKKDVFALVGYPQFKYHDALDHKDTFSEDHDFCRKAISKGFKLWADTSIVCGHIGSKVFKPQ